jgi:hypothetical protein
MPMATRPVATTITAAPRPASSRRNLGPVSYTAHADRHSGDARVRQCPQCACRALCFSAWRVYCYRCQTDYAIILPSEGPAGS